MMSTNDSSLAQRLKATTQCFPLPGSGAMGLRAGKLLAYRILTDPWGFTFSAFPLIFLATYLKREINTDSEHTLDHVSSDSLQTRFGDVQAALGLAQLASLASRNQKRRENAEALFEDLKKVDSIQLPPRPSDRTHLFMHYAIRVTNRERWVRALIRSGIDAQRDYCSFCPKLPGLGPPASRVPYDTPVAESLDQTVLYLPNQPSLNLADMRRIAQIVKKLAEYDHSPDPVLSPLRQ